MRTLASVLTAILVALAFPSIVFGAELLTSAVVLVPGEIFSCSALNASNEQRQITVAIRDLAGTTTGFTTASPNPGGAVSISFVNTGTNVETRSCSVSVDGPKSSVRAGANISPGGAFLPAQ
jgi:hypothetical protein